ncbi:UDP-glucuronosyltransferase 1-6-like [Eleutherodactylus coqui]|uniref:UDP-glucuronosyltransferase 1-6-like n=1 Tax=Eleutherodactylus coqui TaxID=57060 RepID=UPI00346285DE
MNTQSICGIVIRSIIFFITFRFTEGGKLLVIPQDGSHWLSMRSLVEKLSENGHQIVIIVPEVNFYLKNLDHYTVKTFQGPLSKELMESLMKEFTDGAFVQRTFLQKMTFVVDKMINGTNLIISACENLLQNETLIKYLEKSHFDAMLSDPVFPCGEIIAEHLSIPSVFFMRTALFSTEMKAALSPSPPSYVPRAFTTFTDHMTFSQRVINVLWALMESIGYDICYMPFTRIASQFLHRDVTVLDLFSRASIMLLRNDFAIEFPRPVMPNMIFIGGINCANKKLLNQVHVVHDHERGHRFSPFTQPHNELAVYVGHQIADQHSA